MKTNSPQNSVKRRQGLRLVGVTVLVVAVALVGVAGAGTVAAEETEEAKEKPENPFKVEIGNTNSPVKTGGAVTVTATVTNTGNETGSQTVRADASDLRSSGVRVRLTEGGSETVTLSIPTYRRHIGGHTVTVESDDRNATTIDHNSTATVTVKRD